MQASVAQGTELCGLDCGLKMIMGRNAHLSIRSIAECSMLLAIKNDSFRSRQQRIPSSGIREHYYVFVTALVDLGRATEKSFWFSNFDTFNFTSHAQAFGREPNALPQNCN